ARVVVAIADELDRKGVLGPAAVDVAPAGGAVGHRQRQTGRSQELDEQALEFAELYPLALEDPVELPGAWGVRAASQRRVEPFCVHSVANLGFVRRACQVVR